MITKDTENLENRIKLILGNKDLEIHFQSPTKEYCIVYSTSIVAKEIIEPESLFRNYYMIDEKGFEIASPWDSYDEAKQTILATNLIKFAQYKLESIYDGWTQRCPQCNSTEIGKIWRNSSARCEALVEGRKCGYKFSVEDKSKNVVALEFN